MHHLDGTVGRVIALLLLGSTLPAVPHAQAAPLAPTSRSVSRSADAKPSARGIGQASEGTERAGDSFDLWVLTADAGYRAVYLRRLELEYGSVDIEDVSSAARGFLPAVGVGMRLRFLDVMLRADGGIVRGPEQGWLRNRTRLLNVDLELKVRGHLERVEPYVAFASGFSAIGGFGAALREVGKGLSARGGNVRLGLGVDVFVSERFSIGGRADVGAVVLQPRGLVASLPAEGTGPAAERTKGAATSPIVGLAYSVGLGCVLHL